MTYDALREFADSIGLLFLLGTFLIALWRALRSAARPHHHAASLIPLRDEDPIHD